MLDDLIYLVALMSITGAALTLVTGLVATVLNKLLPRDWPN